eukprot:CAMPEP_0177618952 /NCGR_PEP_ID=MMETSP0419_2-20121207/25941_1 /TAXON_ID=582737 /ORGANISM="Tetraselmis sp., Strain GSL018" /LENGTH=187 /DNA_ID=CAMNT_0019118067 /DNA_START=20 /DNA_END=583 /DNA_ORIENTATION=+
MHELLSGVHTPALHKRPQPPNDDVDGAESARAPDAGAAVHSDWLAVQAGHAQLVDDLPDGGRALWFPVVWPPAVEEVLHRQRVAPLQWGDSEGTDRHLLAVGQGGVLSDSFDFEVTMLLACPFLFWKVWLTLRDGFLKESGQHDDGRDFVLIQHPPEVTSCLFQRSLCCVKYPLPIPCSIDLDRCRG